MKVDFSKVEKGVLNENVPVDTFDCIEPDMVNYIKNTALEDQKKLIGKTWCWVLNKETLLGFITLATYSIDTKDMPEEQQGKFPYRSIPCLLIGQLAAHKEYSGNNLGVIMVDFAKQKATELAEFAGCRMVALHPLNEVVERWYEKNTGFELLERRKSKKKIMYFNMLE